MFKRFTFIIAFLGLTISAMAQKKMTFTAIDKSNDQKIEQAQILIYINGQIFVQGFTDANGEWQTLIPANEKLKLEVNHVSYQKYELSFSGTTSRKLVLARLEPTAETKEEIIVSGIRTKKTDPGSQVTLKKKEITKQNSGKDMPYVLEQTPSVVTYSDAGAGVGYTGMRIRGVDATRINVTLNGIPYNDAEAQGVFWVDMPDLAASVNSIQIQRGVGTSTNGAAAFGASVNVKTDHINENRFGSSEIGLGSFGTRRISAQLGSGIQKNGWGAQARVSLIQSDGFVDRASSNLYSAFITAAHYGKKSLFKFNAILGKEITYQSWWGSPQPKFEGDTTELNRYINQLWIGGEDLQNLLESDGSTYNYYTYADQVDNYTQNHFQTFYSYMPSKKSKLHFGLNYTRGFGYYEEYKNDETYIDYGLNAPIVGTDTFTDGNLVRRRWLDNHFYGLIFTYNRRFRNTDLTIGGGQHFYNGGHYGEVIWQQHFVGQFTDHRYYENNSFKTMGNVYAKATHKLNSKLTVYGDLQVRQIAHNSKGKDNDGSDTKFDVSYTFINPKAGVNYRHNKYFSAYATFGQANREPVREDLISSSNQSRPKPEQLNNIELGTKLSKKSYMVNFNAYLMDYKDQFVLTGKINDVGAQTRENVDVSYRRGIEGNIAFHLSKDLDFFTNFTLSQNKIEKYKQYVDEWDGAYGQIATEYENTDLAFSPEVIANAGFEYTIKPGISARILAKHIGSQFLDNTSSKDRMLNAYTIVDASLHFEKKIKGKMPFFFDLNLFNLGNQKFAANGYTFSGYLGGERQSFNYVYPQAGFHFMSKIGFKF